MLRIPEIETPQTIPAPSAPVPIIYESYYPVVWEYLQVVSDQALDETKLNALGHEGWELAGILDRDTQVIFFFKRQSR
jgi:hypothetical protein